MAGVPANLSLDAEESAKAQQASLMFAAQGAIDHNPPNTWVMNRGRQCSLCC
jgi:hypothetical protein